MAHLPDELLTAVADRITERMDADVAATVVRYLKDTAERTVSEEPDGTTYVITGDIPAMWLRDSAAQLTPLLYLVEDFPEIGRLLTGLLRRHWRYIAIDPYANAFNKEPNGNGHQDDHTEMKPILWERKFELDSLSYGLDMANTLWRAGIEGWQDEGFLPAARAIVSTFTTEQDHETRSRYRFQRFNAPASDTLVRDGKGRETRPCGLLWSGFRPSDDACEAGFNVPGNFYAARAMGHLAEILREAEPALSAEAARLELEVSDGLAEHAMVAGPDGNRVYAYEVDGFGNHVLMDDANVPSLLSLPYLGCVTPDDPVYQATRSMVLSRANRYFYSGKAAKGIGSPHTPTGYIWHIALSIQGLTARTDLEREQMIELLRATTGGTGMMHESFDANDPRRFTRSWFSWANAMFCELVMVHCGFTRAGR